ncbi:MAG: hypothetical protein JSV22_07730 [Bacteroidales bacterium]|nr:MAG: hypothetical protein JSV22_07730 [Bacteroidales bacterium]
MYYEIRKFIIKSIILTGIIALAGFLAFTTFLDKYYLPIFPWLLLFFLFVNITVHSLLVSSSGNRKIKFETAFLLSFFIKFFGYIIFMIVYISNNKENSLIFVAGLFILYIIYTSFEINSIISFLKSSSGNYKKSK